MSSIETIEQIFAPFVTLLDDASRDELLEAIREARREHGEAWMRYFNAEWPDYVLLIDLAANKTAEEAVPLFKAHAVNMLQDVEGLSGIAYVGARILTRKWCDDNAEWLKTMHDLIRAEIDKPRF